MLLPGYSMDHIAESFGTARMAFNRADTNNDGELDTEEVAEVIIQMHSELGKPWLRNYRERIKNEVEQSMQEFDVNGDGRLQFDEFFRMVTTGNPWASLFHSHTAFANQDSELFPQDPSQAATIPPVGGWPAEVVHDPGWVPNKNSPEFKAVASELQQKLEQRPPVDDLVACGVLPIEKPEYYDRFASFEWATSTYETKTREQWKGTISVQDDGFQRVNFRLPNASRQMRDDPAMRLVVYSEGPLYNRPRVDMDSMK